MPCWWAWVSHRASVLGLLLLDLEGRDGEPRVSCQTGHTLVIGKGCGHLTVGSVWLVL